MTKKIALVLFFLFGLLAGKAQSLPVKKGMVIRKSAHLRKGIYSIAADSAYGPVIIIEGNNIEVDFAGVELRGSRPGQLPDAYVGIAVWVRGGRNIRIRNLKARGYKLGLLATGVEGLEVDQSEFRYLYRQHLKSTPEREDPADRLAAWEGEGDDGLKQGAALYLRDCLRPVVSNCRATGGQHGLLMRNCREGRIYNNDFSFNSGVGLGLYGSSGNLIRNNRFNFNVRGYSHGVYAGNQGSAGIQVRGQSDNNLFYNNSVTHGGEGFSFRPGSQGWDGKDASEAEGNRIIGNDFSFAAVSGLRILSGAHLISGNRIFESGFGIWGQWVRNTVISGNQFRDNRTAIALENGRSNILESNLFFRDGEGVRIWSASDDPARDSQSEPLLRSGPYLIALNSFNHNPVALHIRGTDSLHIFDNTFSGVTDTLQLDIPADRIDTTHEILYDSAAASYPEVPRPSDPFQGNGRLSGRRNIRMTEWGPYDFRYPLIWNTQGGSGDSLRLELLGPKGRLRVVKSDFTLPKSFPDSLPAVLSLPGPVQSGDTLRSPELILEYRGPGFTDAQGNEVPAGRPYLVSYRQPLQGILFSVSFYAFDSLNNPLTSDYLQRVLTQRPFRVENTRSLAYTWPAAGAQKGANDRFLLIADGSGVFPEGDYELSLTADDAVRLYVDGKRLVDEWVLPNTAKDDGRHRSVRVHLSGRHQIRLEYVQLGGPGQLSFGVRKQ